MLHKEQKLYKIIQLYNFFSHHFKKFNVMHLFVYELFSFLVTALNFILFYNWPTNDKINYKSK